MFKKLAISSLGIALLLSPALASADVQSQIASLLAQIKQLQALIAQLQGQSSTSCVDLPRTLTLGSHDDAPGGTGDVGSLQTYLINKSYLNASATGYYGFLTAQAVGKLQLDLGVVSSQGDTAYGIMGPRTRGAIACETSRPLNCPIPSIAPCPTGQHYEYGATRYDSRNCPIREMKCVQDSNANATFSVTPISGQAPLTVAFMGHVSTGGYMTIDYGDGSNSGTIVPIFPTCAPGAACNHDPLYLVEHVYTTTGAYTATLKDSSGNSLGTATITVTGTQTVPLTLKCFSSGYLYATCSGGNAPLVVEFDSKATRGDYNIDFGDGSSSGTIHTDCSGSGVLCPNDGSFAAYHTYSIKGQYTARIYQVGSNAISNSVMVNVQ